MACLFDLPNRGIRQSEEKVHTLETLWPERQVDPKARVGGHDTHTGVQALRGRVEGLRLGRCRPRGEWVGRERSSGPAGDRSRGPRIFSPAPSATSTPSNSDRHGDIVSVQVESA
jgi:hypothetical protein